MGTKKGGKRHHKCESKGLELNSQKRKKMTRTRRMAVPMRQRWNSGMRADLSLVLDILMVKILMNN